jgi:predicted metal-dependent phosphoesterase TrpH
MILDLHNHSVRSDDARAKVENYCQWIRKRELPLDGFVLSEHRQFDSESDYRALEDDYGLRILKAAEVETEYGHVLVFGVTPDLEAAFDFGRVDLQLTTVLREADRCGALAVPCHPGRPRVGMAAHIEARGPVDGVAVIETLNGGSRGDENERALALAEQYEYRGVGGSDAHIVSHIGRCVTEFERDIADEEDLVRALRNENYRAIERA